MTKRYLPIEQVNGIVLRAVPSGDSDLIVHILSPEHGRIVAVAPRMRKANQRAGVRLDGFDLGRFEIKRSRAPLPSISLFVPESSWPEIRVNLDRITAASCICESILLLLPEGTSHDDGLFYITISALTHLSKSSNTREVLSILLQSIEEILSASGYIQKFSAPGGAKRLNHLLSTIESSAEAKLISRTAVQQMIDSILRS